jgi:long-chain fatty acid transport protein
VGAARTTRRAATRAASLAAAAWLGAGAAGRAEAAGLYFADRGVRPAAMAGAFVAGGDDLGAIPYNPAGIYEAGTQVLVDAAWLHFTSDYQRQSLVRQVDPNTGRTTGEFVQSFPSAHGTSPVLPIPTLAASLKLGKHVVVALDAWAPYSAITTYPQTVDGKPAPTRYSLMTLDGSALAIVGAAIAFAPIKQLRIGVAAGVLTGTFRATSNFSGCVPDKFLCAPEQPEWDVLAQLDVGPIFAPAGEVGAIWVPSAEWRVGASFQLPVYVRSNAKVDVRLPSTPVFDRASQDGRDADVAFNLPWVLRAGVQMRAVKDLHVEAGFGFEKWSMHDAITVTPRDMSLHGIALFPETYKVAPIVFPRNFQDSFSLRLGAEYSKKLFGHLWDARAGVSYESSAVPKEYLSVLTIDAPKVTLGLGVGLHLGKLRLDLLYAHVFAAQQLVDPHDAKIAQISPVVANPPAHPDYVNGGVYDARADVVGLGLAYTFDGPAPEMVPGAAPATNAKAPAASGPEPAK